MRPGTTTCFNEVSRIGFEYGCSTQPNAGLCLAPVATACPANPDTPDGSHRVSGLPVAVGRLSRRRQGQWKQQHGGFRDVHRRVYASQQTSSALATQPVSIYPPRYIIERVPKNTSFTSSTTSDSDTTNGATFMFRVTAMGFGANANSQVVLQSIVATTY